MTINLIVFGGNIQNEDGPLLSFCLKAQAHDYKVFVFTDPLHSNMPTKCKTLGELLVEHNIEHKVSSSLDIFEIKKHIGSQTLGVSICSSWIFKSDVIDLFKGRLINYHNAKLPENRGAAACSWQIMRDDKKGQLTMHQIATKVDSGPVCYKMDVSFPENIMCPSDYYKYLEKEEIKFFEEFLGSYKNDPLLNFESFDHSRAYYWPPLHTLTHGWIDWSWTQKQICDFVNAFSLPYQGASTHLKGERVFLKGASLYQSEMNCHPFQSGIVVRKIESELYVMATDGLLKITELNDANGKSVLSEVKEGERFYTPTKALESAKCSKAVRKPDGFVIRNYEKS